MPENTVEIVISGVDQATPAMKQVADGLDKIAAAGTQAAPAAAKAGDALGKTGEEAGKATPALNGMAGAIISQIDPLNQASQAVEKYKNILNGPGGLIGITVAVGAAMAGTQWQLNEMAMSDQRAAASFAAVSGGALEAARNLDAVKEAAAGAMDENTAMTTSAKMLSLGVATTAAEMAELTRVALMLRPAGMGAAQAIDQFSEMLATGNMRSLKDFNISVGSVKTQVDALKLAFPGMSDEAARTAAVMDIASGRADTLAAAGLGAARGTERLKSAWSDLRDESAKEATARFNLVTLISGPLAGFMESLASAPSNYPFIADLMHFGGSMSTDTWMTLKATANAKATGIGTPGPTLGSSDLTPEQVMGPWSGFAPDMLQGKGPTDVMAQEALRKARSIGGDWTAFPNDMALGRGVANPEGDAMVAAAMKRMWNQDFTDPISQAGSDATRLAGGPEAIMAAKEKKEREEEAALKKQTSAWESATKEMAKKFDDALHSIPGLFTTSGTTPGDMAMAKAGLYQDKPDEYLRRLRDTVENKKTYAGVSVSDAASRVGMSGAPGPAVLAEMERQWNSGELFANPANKDLINWGAVQQGMARNRAGEQGQANITAWAQGLPGGGQLPNIGRPGGLVPTGNGSLMQMGGADTKDKGMGATALEKLEAELRTPEVQARFEAAGSTAAVAITKGYGAKIGDTPWAVMMANGITENVLSTLRAKGVMK